MATNNDLSARLEQTVTGVAEDERLRSNLTDEEAGIVLRWGQKYLEDTVDLARLMPTGTGLALLGESERRVKLSAREANDLIKERAQLSDSALRERLTRLASIGGSPSADKIQQIDGLVRRRNSDPALDFLASILALVPRPGEDQSAHKSDELADSGKRRGTSPSCLIGILAGILLFGVIAYLAVTSLRGQPAAIEPVATRTANTAYQVYFTSPKYPDKSSDHQGGLDEKLTAFINESVDSVDMAIYQLDLENVTQVLLNAKTRGATVRVVTGIDILDDPKENPSFKKLQGAGISVVGGNPNAIMHDKFVVVDKKAVWTGSWNFTENDTYRYNNNAIAIRSPELAQNYTATFEKMWRDKKFGPSRKPGGTTPHLTINGATVENYFAPEDDVAEKIVARLATAGKTIDFMAFSFTDDNIGNTVLEKAKSGIIVRGVFEKTGSETQYSEYGRMQKAGLDVRQDGNPYLMHHKVFIVDGKTVIFGSFNFSQNAEKSNDENLLIIDDSNLASLFLEEFGQVYSQAKNPPTH